MNVVERGISRESVVRFYANYDMSKKSHLLSDLNLDSWDWNDPIAIDRELSRHSLKKGVLAAYRTWKLAEFSLSDLLECAIFNGIFPQHSQALSLLKLSGKLANWRPDRETSWLKEIEAGRWPGKDSALILRPALRSESPAKWYIEDGSGRALAILKTAFSSAQEQDVVTWAYVGDEPDAQSLFIRDRPELLSQS